MLLHKPKFVAWLILLSLSTQVTAFDSGSSGADGTFAPTSDATIILPEDGILNFTTVNIPAGVTVNFRRNAANTPAYILVQGDAVIDGVIDVSGSDGTEFYNSPPGGFAGGLPQAGRGGTGKGPGGGLGGQPTIVGGNGGSYGSPGAQGTRQPPSSITAIYGSTVLQPLLGGSGGGAVAFVGAGSTISTQGARGGGGGGAILIAVSGTLTLNGSILATGGDGAESENLRVRSGGGSGGAVRLIASTLAGAGNIDIRGGNKGDATSQVSAEDGGAGGYGRARLEADAFTFTGGVTPVLVNIFSPSAIFAATLPNVSITSVAGVSVSTNPTGDSDVILPTSISNPVTIGLAATDVPLDSTIDVTLTPSNGSSFTVTGSALSGTVANSTSTAQVTLPQGASTLVATVSFVVSGGMASLYAPYTNGELVAKVELRSTLGEGTDMLLTTESGNVYRVNRDASGL